jgi:hypothetical protein
MGQASGVLGLSNTLVERDCCGGRAGLDPPKPQRSLCENPEILGPQRLKRLPKNGVAAALCRHLALKSLELWRGEPAATPRPATLSPACEAAKGFIENARLAVRFPIGRIGTGSTVP